MICLFGLIAALFGFGFFPAACSFQIGNDGIFLSWPASPGTSHSTLTVQKNISSCNLPQNAFGTRHIFYNWNAFF
jgi:hypothetical protein